MENKTNTQVNEVVSKMRDGELTNEELNANVATLDKAGLFIEFCKAVVTMAGKYFDSKIDEELKERIHKFEQVLFDKDCSDEDKEKAKVMILDLNDAIKKRDRNKAAIVGGVALVLLGGLIALLTSSNKK